MAMARPAQRSAAAAPPVRHVILSKMERAATFVANNWNRSSMLGSTLGSKVAYDAAVEALHELPTATTSTLNRKNSGR